MQPGGRWRREFWRDGRERSDRVPKVLEEPVAKPLERSPEVATRERSDEPPKASRQRNAPEGCSRGRYAGPPLGGAPSPLRRRCRRTKAYTTPAPQNHNSTIARF